MRRRLPLDPVEEARRHWVERGWEPAADGMAAVMSVMRAQQILLSRTESALRPLDLTFARYELLMLLMFSKRGELPMRVIGDRLQVHPTSVSSAVDRLVAAGLVVRTPNPRDGRAVLVGLTRSGRTSASKATEVLNAGLFRDAGIPGRRTLTLIEVLRAMRQRAGDF
ncbi:MAG: MarR family transcriptional regulator [Pseudorhodobacter sp.]|nr:MarR family transcriptional regulator [Frankiaceae bacterium]